MINFLLRRLMYGFFVLVGIVLIVFVLFMILPGDPARLTLGQRADVATLDAINRDLGLDQPRHVQLAMYLNDISPLSIHRATEDNQGKYNYTPLFHTGEHAVVLKAPYLRRSYQSQRRVGEILMEALPNTAVLALTALAIATVLGIGIGIITALKRGTFTDHALMIIAILGISTPSFFAGVVIAWLFGFILSDLTGLNMFGSLYEYDPYRGRVIALQNLVLPALTLGIRPLAIISQLTRSSMLDVLSQDYMRTAKSKGLTQNRVIYKHGLRNALNPVLTAVSGWLASLMAGAFFVEYIFGWNGIGKITVDALAYNDFPVVMGAVLLVGTLFVVINILVDILYGILDPRIRIQ